MDEKFYEVDIPLLKKLFPKYADTQLGNEMVIAHIKYDKSTRFLREPFRFNGYMAIFCIKGSFSMSLNLRHYSVREDSLIFCIPGFILSMSDLSDDDDIEVIIIALAQSVISSIHFDFKMLFAESVRLLDNPVLSFSGDELGILKDYFALALKVAGSSVSKKEDIITPLISSLLFVVGSAWFKKYERAREVEKVPKRSARTNLVFENFLKLVTEYHASERNVSFYAQELCLSPKYLSKIVREVSGKSAPEWIDSFVILEAKNMLRCSTYPIKEIVYRLHFNSQSVFYKFFKSHTGMTPSDYRDQEKKH